MTCIKRISSGGTWDSTVLWGVSQTGASYALQEESRFVAERQMLRAELREATDDSRDVPCFENTIRIGIQTV
jgi:hypothetical protein